ncbi:GspH/FimT family pseudopilin [Ectothiorhodospira haloalkaliphila]|uniref:pilus assembly FimT family protein n=1 Tax=Ectothiorhodospira haloalkaliphila TaxID=421628 RepID=UPI001EE956F4|nr:GspH/FimT family pseudopilin [Ectothiorhodospira haloalkaliphila]MCG5525896.1 GspH/FimT family pseudopilin [Ectothiorhodospira haloalkaliphila]
MHHKRNLGFTLIELVIVLVLLGILVITTLPRVDFRIFSDNAFERELSSALQYARREAMNTGCPVKVVIKPDIDRFDVKYVDDDCPTNGVLPHPLSNGDYWAQSSSGNVIKSVSEPEIVFTHIGSLDADSSIEIEFQNGRKLILQGGTGYIQLSKDESS